MEVERDAIHAVALPGGFGAVLEDVSEMAAATAAMNFRSGHKKTSVGFGFDRAVERRPEARPAGAAVELGVRSKKRLAAAGAMVDPGAVLFVERARSGALGAMLP